MRRITVEEISGSLWEAIQPHLRDDVNEKEVVAEIAKAISPYNRESWVPVSYVHRDDVLTTFRFVEEMDGTLIYSGPEAEEERRRKIVEWFIEQDDEGEGTYLLTVVARAMNSALLEGMYWEILEHQITQAYEAKGE